MAQILWKRTNSQMRAPQEAAELLCGWLMRNGWAGYDSYLIQEHNFFRWLKRWPRVFPLKHIRYPLYQSIYFFPELWLNILRVKPKIIPKGMGLMASGYLDLWKYTGNDIYLNEAKKILEWLENNPSQGYSGLCWGYPFNWESHRFVPEGTPSSVVSYGVGQAFLKAYQYLGDRKYLTICESICKFLGQDLLVDRISNEEICFSYTPLGKDHVHNANLFAAEFLVSVGSIVGNSDWIDMGRKATMYTVRRQRENGAFWYYGEESRQLGLNIPERAIRCIDNFHTGFVIRSLRTINDKLCDPEIEKAFEKGAKYYVNKFFPEGDPPLKFHHDRIWPVDIHSCSESICSLTMLRRLGWPVESKLNRVVEWTLAHMQDYDGHFYYQKHPFLTVKVPYIRWGQAWMLYSLMSFIIDSKTK